MKTSPNKPSTDRERITSALAKLDRLLSAAQDVTSELTSVEMREDYPTVHRLGDRIFDQLEKARQAIYRRGRPTRA